MARLLIRRDIGQELVGKPGHRIRAERFRQVFPEIAIHAILIIGGRPDRYARIARNDLDIRARGNHRHQITEGGKRLGHQQSLDGIKRF
ncbi:MAG TPA: hypothetical protein PKX13_12045 [Acidiphilium sp.]|nr:hypothetical protein [Acidiphilium sp.]